MSTVSGVPADTVAAASLALAWPSITEAVRQLHELPVASCPFSRDVLEMMNIARDVVARGAVNPQYLPAELKKTRPVDVLASLEVNLRRRREQERADTVVCHGDL